MLREDIKQEMIRCNFDGLQDSNTYVDGNFDLEECKNRVDIIINNIEIQIKEDEEEISMIGDILEDDDILEIQKQNLINIKNIKEMLI